MNRNRIAWLLPILLLAGCRQTAKPVPGDNRLEGTWTLYDVSSLNSSVDASVEAQMKNDLDVGSIISLFRDSSFTKTEGNGEFAAGNWHMNAGADKIALTTRTGLQKDSLIYIEPPSADHAARVLYIARDGFLYRYEKKWAPLADDRNDPFYRTNNKWRITPQNLEDSTHLKERIANYIQHLALLLKAAKERKETEVSFVYSSGPALIANDGVSILPYSETRRSWKNGFYSDEEAYYAYSLYSYYLSQPRDEEARTGNWIEDDYRILMSLYPAFHKSRREAVRVR